MKTKSKIPAVVRAYLRKAPKIKGYKVLSPLVKAEHTDSFLYLHNVLPGHPPQLTPMHGLGYSGYIQPGRTLLKARVDGVQRIGQYNWKSFDGVIYRPVA